MKKALRRILVVCGNHQQFVEWEIKNQSKIGLYVNDPIALKGMRGCEVEYYGTYWTHGYAKEIEDEIIMMRLAERPKQSKQPKKSKGRE